MKLVNLLFLYFIGIVSTGCTTNSPLAVTPQASILPEKTQAKPKTTNQSMEVATDTQKPNLKVGDISELKDDKTCDDIGEIIVYAETQNYWTYICGDKQEVSKPTFFKAKSKNDKKMPSIFGKATLGWQQISFVGISGDYTYSMSIPSRVTHSSSDITFLYIHPFILGKSTLLPKKGSYEKSIKYLSIGKYRQSRKWWSSEPTPLLDSKKNKFIKYLMDNRENLQVCEDREREHSEGREKDSVLYKLEDGRYFLQLRCNVYLKYNSFNFFLISEQIANLEVKFLAKPEDEAIKGKFGSTDKYEGRVISGRPLFDPLTRTLSIHVPFSGLSRNGYLSTFAIKNDQLKLIEFRYASKDDSFYIDPILYPVLYP